MVEFQEVEQLFQVVMVVVVQEQREITLHLSQEQLISVQEVVVVLLVLKVLMVVQG